MSKAILLSGHRKEVKGITLYHSYKLILQGYKVNTDGRICITGTRNTARGELKKGHEHNVFYDMLDNKSLQRVREAIGDIPKSALEEAMQIRGAVRVKRELV